MEITLSSLPDELLLQICRDVADDLRVSDDCLQYGYERSRQLLNLAPNTRIRNMMRAILVERCTLKLDLSVTSCITGPFVDGGDRFRSVQTAYLIVSRLFGRTQDFYHLPINLHTDLLDFGFFDRLRKLQIRVCCGEDEDEEAAVGYLVKTINSFRSLREVFIMLWSCDKFEPAIRSIVSRGIRKDVKVRIALHSETRRILFGH